MRNRDLVLAVFWIFGLGCAGDGPSSPAPETPRLTSINLTPTTLALEMGETKTLTAVALDQKGLPLQASLTWSSDNTNVVSVNASGAATGVSVGATTVSVSAGSLRATAAVNVTQIPVATVSVSPSSLPLTIGQSQRVIASVKDHTGNELTNRTVAWTIADPSIASITNDGTVTALATGSTTATATCEGVTGSSTIVVTSVAAVAVSLNYAKDLGLAGTPASLSARVTSADPTTRSATVSGGDSRAPTIPFTFNWGDGSSATGFFPSTHTYANAAQNYVVQVIAHYSSNSSDTAYAVVRFTASAYTPLSLPSAATVTIPVAMPALMSRQAGYGFSSALQAVPNSSFTTSVTRNMMEYVLSQAAVVELGILENDVEKVDNGWRQVVVNDPSFGGAYSIWYSSPMALALASSFLQPTPGYSSLFHEMGHNFSLNAPAAFRFGGRIDGNANAIFSESVAQMFQHAVAFEIVNNASRYGLPADLSFDIAESAHASAQNLQRLYDSYLSAGRPFTTWNDPATPLDETLGSFISVARQFMIHAEQANSYIAPLTRVMRLLRTFNATIAAQYAQSQNTSAANTFRATLMVAAVSYGFQQDLRAEFRALNFPIDDAIYQSLYNSVP